MSLWPCFLATSRPDVNKQIELFSSVKAGKLHTDENNISKCTHSITSGSTYLIDLSRWDGQFINYKTRKELTISYLFCSAQLSVTMCNPEAEYIWLSVYMIMYMYSVLQIKDILLPVPLSYMQAYIGSCYAKV